MNLGQPKILKPNTIKSLSASTSQSAQAKKGLVVEAYEWDKEYVSSDNNEMVEVKVLMALVDDGKVVVGKESARNGEWVKISIKRSTSRKVSNDSSDRIAAIANKLDSLGRDMKKLKENVHAIQVGCKTCGGAHLDKEYPLHEEVKSVEEVKYGEFGRSFPNNKGNMARYLVGVDAKKRQNGRVDEETSKEHGYEHKTPKCLIKEFGNTDRAAGRDYHAKAANEVPNSSTGKCKAIIANDEAPRDETSSNGTNELHKVSFISDDNVQVSKETDEGPSQLHPEELCLGSFTLPYTIGSLNIYAMADLGASVNIMPRSMLNHLKLTNLKETNMLVEMAGMPMGIVENGLVKIDKFLFPSDFMIIDMLDDPNETMILGRPFLDTIIARIDVFDREIPLGIGKDRIVFYMNGICTIRLSLLRRGNLVETGKTKMVEPETKAVNPNKPRPHDYSFKEWLKVKVGHTNVSKTVKNVVLNEWVLNSLRKSQILQKLLANEYELRIGKKGYILDDILEKCKQVHEETTYPWHDEGFEEEDRWESGLYEKYYNPPQVCIETFEGNTTKRWKLVIILARGYLVKVVADYRNYDVVNITTT
ncbi:RNA-directed DNA polymerase, eukaryota, reverse transcriptase zinc-binding domain protein [Tanacetum coccineum]|uniref:RNA-directed DNA polymerase, eukaryota, reverse transcriptase zinc-binding domain protein n=1 Tax=Tanacetum coccineum TaxID=301880 RepID=A0ABQ4XHR3_9ASTR